MTERQVYDVTVSIRADASELLEERSGKNVKEKMEFQFALMRVNSAGTAEAHPEYEVRQVSIRADASELLEVDALIGQILMNGSFNSR